MVKNNNDNNQWTSRTMVQSVNKDGTKKLPHRTTLTVEQTEPALTQAECDTELLISIRSGRFLHNAAS